VRSKTKVQLVFHTNPLIRAEWIEQLLQASVRLKKITLLANSEVFTQISVASQNELFYLDEMRKGNGIHVLRLAPGCACCSAKLILTTHLSRTLRLSQPDLLVLELDSKSHPDQVIAMLQEPQWNTWLSEINLYTPI
jgi:G3E family GTPase